MTTSKRVFVQFDLTMILQRIKEFVAFAQCDSTFIFDRGAVHTVPGSRGDAAEDR